MSKSRLEAFSDGVIAVAITLLVLDLTVPRGSHHLGHDLGTHWTNYVAFATSFITLGIIWINHHAMINRLRQPDHAILALNLLLLMFICVLPFATSLMAAYLSASRGQHLAAAIYSGSFLLMSITFALLNHHILFQKAHLLAVELPEERRHQILRRSVIGLAPYAIATALAPVSPYVTVGICAAIAAYYGLPIASSSEQAG